MKHLLYLALLLSLFNACTVKDSAGTTSETENEVALSIMLPDGRPASQARVTLFDRENYDSLIAQGENTQLDQASTDSKGRVTLLYKGNPRRVGVLAQTSGFAVLSPDSLSANSTLHMQIAGAISGHTDAVPGSKVILDGTSLSALVDTAGNYSFTDVPQGTFAILMQASQSAPVFAGTAQIYPSFDQQQDLTSDGFLVDDFDDGDSLPAIAAFGAGNLWYLYSDNAGTTFLPTGIDTRITLGMGETDAWRGKSFTLQTMLTNSIKDAYGSLACQLGRDQGRNRVDLREMDSVTLYVKGSGQIRLIFTTDYIHTQYDSTQAYADLGAKILLPAEWTRISIPIEDLLPPEDSKPYADGLRWKDVAQSVDLLVIGTWDNAGYNVTFSVDEIRLHGIPHNTFR